MERIFLFYRRIRRKLKKMLVALHRRDLLKVINGGEGLHLEDKITLIHGKNLTLGRHVHIGADAYLNCKGGVTIGDHTILSRRVVIYSYDHNFKMPSCLPFDDAVVGKPVYIGRYVWIGMNVMIAPGTVVGDGAVLGMGSVVSGNIPENAIVVGTKTRIIAYRDKEHTKKLAMGERFYESYWGSEALG